MENKEHQEAAPERREELFTLLSDVEGLVGSSVPMLSDEAWSPAARVHLPEVQADARQFENTRWLRQEVLRFEEIVQRNVRQHFFEQQQILTDGAAFSPEGMKTLEQISLRMTLWKYEEAHLKEYLEALQRYRTHSEKFQERSERLRSDAGIQKYELMSAVALGRLKEILPVQQTTTRLVWALELLQADEQRHVLSPQDRAQLTALTRYLRQRLPAKGTPVHPALLGLQVHRDSPLEELQAARNVLAGKMREVFVETVEMDAPKARQSPAVGVPYALYLRSLHLHRRAAFEELRDAKAPTVDQFTEFLDVSRSINQESLAYHVDTLKHSADVQSLLAMRERFGPEAVERLRSNPRKSQEVADFYKRFLLPADSAGAPGGTNLGETLKERELSHYQAGMQAYLELVSEDVTRYGSVVDRIEHMLMDARVAEDLMFWVSRKAVEITFWIPEHTLGYARFVGLDYTKLIGQYEGMQNHRAVTEFRAMEEDTESMKTIFTEAQPGLRTVRTALLGDMQQLTSLQKEHPPEACAPGKAHNGVAYEEIRRQYIGVIERMRSHHEQWTAQVDALFGKMQSNLNYHVNRLAQHRLLNAQNAPNAVVGALVTALELYYATGNVKYLHHLAPGSRLFARAVNFPIKQGGKMLYKGGQMAAGRLRASPAPAPEAPARAPKAPGRVGNILGKASIVLVAIETVRQVDLALSLRSLPEAQAVNDALELMRGHPRMKRADLRYGQEVEALRQRQALIAMRHATDVLVQELEKRTGLSAAQQTERERLLQQAKHIVKSSISKERDLHQFFPITEYLKRSSRDPDGVVRVAYGRLHEARQRGMDHERQKQLFEHGSLLIPDKRSFAERMEQLHWSSTDGIEGEYDKFVSQTGVLLGAARGREGVE